MSHAPHGAFQEAIAAAQSVAELPKRQMWASEAEMAKAQLPMDARDYCAHLLIPLNRCRVDNLYLPWTCQQQKHAYEKCVYEDYLWRTKKKQLLNKEAKIAAKQAKEQQ